MEKKEAIAIAKQEVADTFEKPVSAIRLEEIDLSDVSYWNITVSFVQKGNEETDALGGLYAVAAALNANGRTYKIVKVRKANGEVISIKNAPK
ncbi:hypothetical protein [Acinetobacter higginsii]|uniref:hypothetical protein n=1 Tax=Acinetobacter higginsii TaxID=70347 RepID=UPI002675FAD4|nr:hypothetical protein [Acinetobacter higginsii]MDO3663412.1 hypothetical protein [Acinetobacter higginsii]